MITSISTDTPNVDKSVLRFIKNLQGKVEGESSVTNGKFLVPKQHSNYIPINFQARNLINQVIHSNIKNFKDIK